MTVRERQSAEASVSGRGFEGDSTPPLGRVQNHRLPEASTRLIESYEEIVGDRDRFLWQWAHHLFPKFTLSCVPSEYADDIQDTKLVGLMFVSILDDVAEKHQDRATLEEATKIPFDHQTVDRERHGVDGDVLSFAIEVWDEFEATVERAPRAAEFGDILQFDLKQVLNAMDYSYLANQELAVVNGPELRTYDAHNMMLYGFADVDLVHSPSFDTAELATLRQVLERAQRMVRIGNWVTTWEREVAEGDFTSGIVAYALDEGIVSTHDLRASQDDTGATDHEAVISTIRDHDVEAVFLRRWQDELAAAREFEDACDSVDVGSYLDGIETVLEYHLASRGLK